MTDREERVIDAEYSEASSSGRLRLIPWALLALSLAFLGGVLASPYFANGLRILGILEQTASLPEPGPVIGDAAREAADAAIAPLASRLVALEAALAALDQANDTGHQDLRAAIAEAAADTPGSAAGDVPGNALAALEARLAALEAMRPVVEAPMPSVAPANDGIEARIMMLEEALSRLGSADKGDGGLALVALSLNRRLISGEPYRAELARLTEAIAALPAPQTPIAAPLRLLHARAEAGIPTLAGLQADFAPVAAAMLRAAPKKSDGGFLARLKDGLAGLVTIRRLDAADGPEAVINSAEVALLGGDVGAALAALDALPPGMQQAGADWIASAKAHETSLRALDGIIAALADDGQ